MREPTRRVFCLAVAVLVASVVPFCGVKLGAPAWLTLSAWLVAVVIPFITDWIIYVRPETFESFPRYCDRCNGGMIEGYCLHDGLEYYCSKPCLFTNGFTQQTFDTLWSDDAIYWTSWDGEAVEDWHEQPNREEAQR
tara:strand:+ start:61 stop:471 length:411 start_codon:yes stop_codon:yes gene_type:complete